MGWLTRRQPPSQEDLAAVQQAITAAATVVQGPGSEEADPYSMQRQLRRVPQEWQREVWDFYDSLGEFRQGVTWKSNMMSRVRLRAAKKSSTDDEPTIVDTGPAHDILAELGGGVGGQAQIMSQMTVHVDVPGECYLIGETIGNANTWYVRSLDEVRRSSGTDGYAVADARAITKWRDLPPDSLVVRVHRPHPRWYDVADSPARAARPTLRELELINRHIQAQYMSRLASAGVVVFPEEITFPVRPEFENAPDPFIAEWIEVAAEALRTPGTAAAVVPIPMRMPGEFIDKVKHIDFTLKLDDRIIEKRDNALARLAIALDMPPEALLGTRNVNHWSAWLIDEQGVKIHIAPTCEVICDALTKGYLWPRLQAAGEDISNWVVWYDASELILRPDRSESALNLYDRAEINAAALRRENGFDESDAPDAEERRVILLQKAALQPVNTFEALAELGYETTHDTPVNEPRPPAQTPPENAPPVEPGPPPDAPDTRPKNKNTAAITEQLVKQAKLMHAVKVDFDGTHHLLHPAECTDHLFSCPVTHATWKPLINVMPGQSGSYQCWLNARGGVVVGERILNTEGMIESTRPPVPLSKIASN